METENLLTHEQRETQLYAEIDLATGYPAFPFSESYRDLLTEFERHSLSSRAFGALGPRALKGIRADFEGVVTDLLNIDDSLKPFIEATFSGSIAIQRSIAAFEILAAKRGSARPTFIILEPCVDFYRTTLSELHCSYVVVNRFQEGEPFDLLESVQRVLQRLALVSPDVFPVIMLDSPSNPLGEIVGLPTLMSIAEELERAGGGMIFDHCFALAGVHDSSTVPLAFRERQLACPWIGVWDTGKTFDLNGDKIGVLVASGSSIFEAVLASLETIQVSSAARDLQFFADFLGSDVSRNIVTDLRSACLSNIALLSQVIHGDCLMTPSGGTFANLRLPDGSSSTQTRATILRRGLSVSSGASFRSGLADNPPFIRLSLARTESTFLSALAKLLPLV